MKEEILSVGIDIGTSTIQLVFSKLSLEKNAECVVEMLSVGKAYFL